jgi:hypothetical protein
VSKVFASKRVEPPSITYQGCLSHGFSFSIIDLHGRLKKRKKKNHYARAIATYLGARK